MAVGENLRAGVAPAFWLDRPTLVTGGTGLLGSWLVQRLLDLGADIVCLVRDWVPKSDLVERGAYRRVTLVKGDIRDQSVIERCLGEYEIDTVMHLAAQTVVGVASRNPVSTLETNIAGTWRLLEACRRSPSVQQVVVASSDKAYGEQAAMPYVESMPLQGRHPYDVSKSAADLIAHCYSMTYATPVVITRCGNFFGGGDLNWSRVVPGTIRSVIRGKRPIIRSDGQYRRDYLYVEDAAAAYTMLAEQLAGNPDLKGESFNFSNEQSLSVVEIVELILRLMGSELKPIIRNVVTNEIRSQCLSAEKATKMLGWSSRFTVEEGLTRTIDWYRTLLAQP